MPDHDRQWRCARRSRPVAAARRDQSKHRLSARFKSTYIADAAYFASAAGNAAVGPKTPFSALVIAGRSAWTGTVLFYPVSYSNGKALTPCAKVRAQLSRSCAKKFRQRSCAQKPQRHHHVTIRCPATSRTRRDATRTTRRCSSQNDTVEVTLKVISPAPRGWFERLLGTAVVQPITLTLDMPDIPWRPRGARRARAAAVTARDPEVGPYLREGGRACANPSLCTRSAGCRGRSRCWNASPTRWPARCTRPH